MGYHGISNDRNMLFSIFTMWLVIIGHDEFSHDEFSHDELLLKD